MHQPVTPDKHYAPKYQDMPDVGEAIASLIKVPVEKVPARTFFTENPFEVFATDWYWLNAWGPMSMERFFDDLETGCKMFCEKVNEYEVFRAYPITYIPDGKMGLGFMDWTGGSYPVDIRLFFRVASDIMDERYKDEEGNPIAMSGLAFYLTTLVAVEEQDSEEC